MQTTLQPPAIHTLSEHVIGHVVQRAWSIRDKFGAENENAHDEAMTQHHFALCSPDSVHAVSNLMTKCVTFESPVLNSSKSGSERSSTQRSSAGRRGFKTGGRRSKECNTATAQRREYYRCKQQRYRENQRKLVVNLEDKILQLHEEVEQLKRTRERFTVQVPRRLTIWIVATEYFRIFESGVLTHESMSSNDLEFLRATISPDTSFGTVRGLDAHLDNWGLFTQYFPDVHIDLKQLKQIRDQSLIADITATFTISETSMWHVFPHLFASGERTRCARIAARMRGQTLVLQGSVRFEWDDEINQVSYVHTHLDMMSALLQKWTDLEDVALIFNKALITPECNFREESATQF